MSPRGHLTSIRPRFRGRSTLTGHDLPEWMLSGDKRYLILASNSVKTEEFKDTAPFVDELLRQDAPALDGERLSIETHEVIDPMTGCMFGHRFVLEVAGRRRDLIFLANLMPLSFMFYSIPTEFHVLARDDRASNILRFCQRKGRDGG